MNWKLPLSPSMETFVAVRTMIAGTLTAAVFALGVATSATSQQKPDFSGEWVLNRPASTLSPGSDGVQSGVVRIEHREPMFRYKATLVSGATPFEYGYELTTDGREVEGAQQGRPSASSLRWDGDALAFTGRIGRADSEVKVSFR